MPVHDPSSESFDWETIFKSSDRCGETVARTCLFGQRRTSQVSYYNMSTHNVYYVKCNVVLNNVIFDSCLFPHQHYDRHSFHARECCAIRQNVRGDKSSMAFNNHFAHYSLFSYSKAGKFIQPHLLLVLSGISYCCCIFWPNASRDARWNAHLIARRLQCVSTGLDQPQTWLSKDASFVFRTQMASAIATINRTASWSWMVYWSPTQPASMLTGSASPPPSLVSGD